MAKARNYDVFISYSRATGSSLAQVFRNALEHHGRRVFLDVHADYWSSFPEELSVRVRQTPYVLVLLTPECTGSQWMEREVELAMRERRQLLVVCESSFKWPDDAALSDTWRQCKTLNYRTYIHEFSDEVLRQVVEAVEPARRMRVVVLGSTAAALFIGLAVVGAWKIGILHRENTTDHSAITTVGTPSPQNVDIDEPESTSDSTMAALTPDAGITRPSPAVPIAALVPDAGIPRSPPVVVAEAPPSPSSPKPDAVARKGKAPKVRSLPPAGAPHAAAASGEQSLCSLVTGYDVATRLPVHECRRFGARDECESDRAKAQGLNLDATGCSPCPCPK